MYLGQDSTAEGHFVRLGFENIIPLFPKMKNMLIEETQPPGAFSVHQMCAEFCP